MLGLRSRDSAARAHTGAARPPRPRAARPRRDEDAPHTGSAPTGVAWPAPSRPPDEARYGWRVRHPSRVHQRSLPREVALREGAVVLAEEGDTLYLAVARPDDSRLAASLASAARRPVRLVAAGSDELAHALAVCWDFQAPSTVSAQEERLAALARTVGVGYLLDPRGPRPGDPRGDHAPAGAAPAELPPPDCDGVDGPLPSDAAARSVGDDGAIEFPRGWRPELLGLLAGLPHLSLTAGACPAALRLLLPPHLRMPDGSDGPVPLAPLCVERGVLVVACAAPPDEETLHAIAAWTGFEARPVLVEPEALRGAAGAAGADDAAQDGGVAADDDMAPTTRGARPGAADTGELDTRRLAAVVARQTGEAAEQVARRLFGRAVGRGTRASRPRVAGEALALLPLPLLRSLTVAPLRLCQDSLDVALEQGRADDAAVLSLLSALTGRRVWARRVARGETSRLLRELSLHEIEARGAPRRGGAAHGATTVAAPSISAGAPDGVGGAEEWAGVRHALPSIRLERYQVAPEVGGVIPPEVMGRLVAVPMRREGRALWVAVEAPEEDALAELALLTGLSVRPVLATRDAILGRISALTSGAGSGAAPAAVRDHPILRYLQAEGVLTGTGVVTVMADPARPVDDALHAAGILTHDRFAALAGRLGALDAVDLALQARDEEVVDALGQRARRQIWRDPVDGVVAGLLDAATARRAGVLPLRREGDALVVAVADPFAPATEGALSSLGAGRMVVRVAPRPAILAALTRAQGRVSLGDTLLTQGIVSASELARALQLHRATGVRLGQAMLHLGLVTQEQLAFVVAGQQNLPFFALADMGLDAALAGLLPEELERHLGVIPLYELGETLVVVTPDPLNGAALDEVAARTGRPVTAVVCTEDDLQRALEGLYSEAYLERSTSELIARTPEESASRVLSRGQVVALRLVAALLPALLWLNPAAVGIGLSAAASLFYVTFALYRIYLIYRALSHNLEIPVSAAELAALDDADLPVYTILVPLYREASVLPILLHGLQRLDYPLAKLDVKLLLEGDDTETLEAVAATSLPACVHPVVVPAALPRGKPKACNYGLIHARGEYVVIYDAEDVPDPDQLKKVVVGFRKAGPEVVCLQAKLNYYNSGQNVLTNWFTSEYSMWFDLFLPGLDASGAPVPLGGTSNHFAAQHLREVGAWDPYNVTEDADLGIRLFRRGWRAAVIDSTTLEEANSQVYNWIRQRSRWVKGYIQTYLVHMRHPLQLWRALGPKAFFSFTMVVGGTPFGFLVNPIFWSLTALWFLAHAGFIRSLYPAPVFYLGMASLLVGNIAFILLNVAGCLRRGYYGMVKYALVSPLYWALMSVAAWKGFLQLFTNPFYWEKTVHGLYHRPGMTQGGEGGEGGGSGGSGL